ncbi:phage protein [Paraburkholderia sp. MM5477-R1]|uniref:phage protein n=1 Tax=Paraburkholderia sp. MM5477-R1 TaxID=2991062 RepID=UPI003D1D66BD
MANNTQFGRKASLIVSDGTTGLDLSELRFKFETTNSDSETPNTLYARVYNLAPQTIAKIGTEFKSITLQAGYENGNYGVVFSGAIKQTEVGRERDVDNFIDIWAADGDEFYSFAIVNMAVAAGQTPEQVIQSILSTSSVPIKFAQDATGLIVGAAAGVKNALSRGKSSMGMARSYLRDWAAKYGYRWSIQNGEVVVVPITGYRPGEAVVLSSSTGLVGVPVATQGGVRVRALLNPLIRIGCLVQIAQSDINHITTQQFGLSYSQNNQPSAVIATTQGHYRVMEACFMGDTRGNEWYVDLVCLAVDVSAPDQSQSVSAAA